jgi:hypothetical protein
MVTEYPALVEHDQTQIPVSGVIAPALMPPTHANTGEVLLSGVQLLFRF